MWVWWRVVVGVVWSGWLLSLVCAARGDSRGLLRVGGLWLHWVCLRGRVGRGLVYSGGLLRRGWWLVLVSRPIGLDAPEHGSVTVVVGGCLGPCWLPLGCGCGSGRVVSLAVEVSPTWAILVTWFGVVSPPLAMPLFPLPLAVLVGHPLGPVPSVCFGSLLWGVSRVVVLWCVCGCGGVGCCCCCGIVFVVVRGVGALLRCGTGSCCFGGWVAVHTCRGIVVLWFRCRGVQWGCCGLRCVPCWGLLL